MPGVCLDRPAELEVKERAPRSKPRGRLTQKAGLNAAAALLDYTARVAVGLIVTPILVGGLGSSLFGVWQILDRLVGYMTAADGRPTQALKWVIANQQANEDLAAKRRAIGSALGVWFVFLPVLLLTGATLVWIAPAVTKIPAELQTLVRVACALLVVKFLLSGLVMLPESVLRGMNLGYKRMGLVAGLNVVGGVLSVGAVYFGLGLAGLAGAQVALSVLTGLLFWWVVRKCIPWFGVVRPTLAEVRSFLGLSIWYFAWTLINQLLLSSDVIVLGVVTSASMVTTYALTSYAGLTLLTIVSMVLGAVTPGLGGLIGQKQYEKAALLRGEMREVSWLLVTAIGATILLWNRSFVFLWVGREHYAGLWANLLIVLVMAQLVFIRNDTYVIDLTLRQRQKVIMGAVAVVLSIALSVLLIPLLGIAGLCLGLLGGRLVLSVAYPIMVDSYLDRPKRLQLGRVVRPGLVMGLLFLASAYLGQQLLARNWVDWVACAGSTFGLMLGIALVTGLSGESRRSLIRRVKMVRSLRAARSV